MGRALTPDGSGVIMDAVRENKERALHVGVNAHLLSLAENYRSAGISWYIQNLLNHLPEADADVAYTVFLGEPRYGGVPGLRLRVSDLPTHQPLVRILWEQLFLPGLVRRAAVDLVHGLHLVGPMASTCPFVVTVHDLSFLFFPQNFPSLKRLYLRTLTRWSVRRARRIIAISENTKRDVVQQYGLSPEKVDLVYYGLDPIFQPLPKEALAGFRARQGLPEQFILFVGTLEPRKNVSRLVEAYARLSEPRPPLILVGGKGWLYDEVFARVEALGLSGCVHFAGYVPGKELPWWYNAATLFVYPSLYEGFGLPPLEAMACGTPVVSSDVSSLPEVVGQAGLLVDPTDVEDLAGAMGQALADSGLRDEMGAAGLAQARRFSWREAARQTVTTYRRALSTGGGNGRV